MPDPERPPAARAVFLSYTTEDLAVALAVCEALREAGIEVWMDHSALQGGDGWDENIQRQIRDCALFIPLISARTQARREGYFRLEWRLADERMRLVAEGTPLIVPVVADDTRQADALVPKSFLAVQWSRLPHGHVPPALVLRVRKLLGLETPSGSATLPPVATPAAPVADAPQEEDPVIEQRREVPEASSSPFWRRTLPVALVAACAALLVGVFAGRSLRPAPDAEPKTIARFAENLPPGVAFRGTGRPVIALSPDGSSMVYNTTAGLFIRRLSEQSARVIPGTEQLLLSPVFSPDGQSVAYYSAVTGELQRIAVTGGASVRIGLIQNPSGLSWANDGSIIYSQTDGIWRVPAAGSGKPERIIPAESAGERLSAPQLLPGGKFVLFTSQGANGFQVEVRSLVGGERKVVVPGGRAACYLPATGHLLYVVESDLFGVTFNLERIATFGNPVPLVKNVRHAPGSFMANYAVALDGTLLYMAGGAERRVPVWVDRQGKEEPVKLEPAEYYAVRFSPDGTKIVMADSSLGGRNGIVVWDLAGETRIRLTQSDAVRAVPIWTPDGLRVVYPNFGGQLMVKPANNTRPSEVFADAPEGQQDWRALPAFFTTDGRKLVFNNSGRLGSMSIGSAEKPTWLFNATGTGLALSPDGKWIAYSTNDTGRSETYVSPFPNVTDDRVVVSKEGGAQPLWSRDGKEIFYIGGNGNVFPAPLMVATVQADGGKLTVTARKPVWNSTLPYFTTATSLVLRSYDLSPDNQRFIVLKDVKPAAGAEAPDQIFIVKNWTEELKRRVPRPGK